MKEFVFGSLSTQEKRVARIQERLQGVQHYHRLTPRTPGPDETPVATVTIGLDKRVDRVVCEILAPESAVIPLHPVRTNWDLLNWSYYQTWQATLPAYPENTRVRYQIKAYPADGQPPLLADEGAIFSYLVGTPHPPAWAADAIIYQIFPDRFYPENGRSWNPTEKLNDIYGGTLRGIIDQLDYIAALGFNCIWLNPFFPDDTHHGYHATDYFSVNPRLGTLADVQELVQAAHARGIRLLLDFVANHWGHQHPTFQAAQADPNSEYYNWYNWKNWPHEYQTFFGVKALPQLNVEHPGVRQHLFQSIRYWLNDIGFDGLRLDYVLGPSHDFWTELRAVVNEIGPHIWLFGEAVESPLMQLSYEGRFHGCLDFLLAQAMRQTFALGSMEISAFDAFLNQHEAFFPATFSRPSFLDNHDMNRFLFLAQGDKRKLKLAALCQFALSGPPIVYNGTEVGVPQVHNLWEPGSQGFAECRQPMLWGADQDEELHTFYTWLIHLRRQHPALRQGQRHTVHLDAAAGTYAFTRSHHHEVVAVALNLSDAPRSVTIQDIEKRWTHTFALPPWGGDVYVHHSNAG